MQTQYRSRASSIRRSRRAVHRSFRPRVELLENRRLLATGIFIENYADDFDLSLPGFDSRDDNPLTIPGGDTDDNPLTMLGPDEVQLRHCFSRDFSNPSNCGPPANTFNITSDHKLFLSGHDTVTLIGLGQAEFVERALVDFNPIGSPITVQIIGRDDTYTVQRSFGGGWQTAAASDSSIGDHGNAIGPITSILITGSEVLVGDLTILVLRDGPANFLPVAVNDSATTIATTSVSIDVLANDTDPDNDPLSIASSASPLYGTAVNAGRAIIYTPNMGVHGVTDSFAYTVADGFGGTATATVTVEVHNQAPVAADDFIDMPHGLPGFFSVSIPGVLLNDFDPEGDTLSTSVVTAPSRGSVTFDGGGAFTYTPFGEHLLSDSFSYKVNDGFVDSNAATVNIVVANQPSVAVDDVELVPHGFFGDYSVTVPGVRFNDPSDPDGDDTMAVLVSNASGGTVTLHPNGSYTYSPFDGGPILPDSFSYRLFDGQDYSNVATVHIQVPNEAPVAGHDFRRVAPGPRPPGVDPATFQVLVNDSDPDGDPLTNVTLVDPPLHGTATVNGDGTITYEPDAFISAFPGIDMYSYRASDGISESNLAWVTIDVSRGTPVAYMDVYELPPGFSMFLWSEIGVLSNDYSPSGDPLMISSFIGQSVTFDTEYGTVTLYPDGSFQYVSNIDFEAIDSFTYRATDGSFSTETETVVIYVVNDAPQVSHDHYQTAPGSPLVVPAPGVFANDPETSIGISNSSTTSHGALSLHFGNGSFTYRPAPGFVGIDHFSYNVSSGQGEESSPAIVTIQVGQPPVIAPQTFRVPSGGQDDIDLLADFSDPNGLPLSAVRLSGPDLGPPEARLKLHQSNESKILLSTSSSDQPVAFTGVFDYESPADFAGLVTFTYVATDGPFESEPATATIHVNAPPVAVNDDISLRSNTADFRGGLLDNDRDADGDFFRARLVSPPSDITLESFDSGGGFNYRIPATFHGVDSFTYEVFDNWDVSVHVATVTIRVADPDIDQDGINNSIEDAAPNGGDGNADGVPDRQQHNVVSLPNAADGRYVTLAAPAGTSFVNVQAVLPPESLPPHHFSIVDFFSFELLLVTPGDSATVTAILPPGVNPTSYIKFGPTPTNIFHHWYTFSFDGTTGAEINGNLVALHFVDGQRGDDDLLVNGVIVEPGGPAMVTLPQIESVAFNDDHAQRSMINSVTVTFDRRVTIDHGAFELRQNGMKKPIDLKVSLSEFDSRTVALLTFKGAGVQHGSLKDGHYTLTIRATKIRDAEGRLLDGDGDDQEGGNYVEEFFRRFGDTDGDDDVDLLDAEVLGSTFGKRSHHSGYLWYLDFNANGRVWAEDLALFLLGYCRSNQRR